MIAADELAATYADMDAVPGFYLSAGGDRVPIPGILLSERDGQTGAAGVDVQSRSLKAQFQAVALPEKARNDRLEISEGPDAGIYNIISARRYSRDGLEIFVDLGAAR